MKGIVVYADTRQSLEQAYFWCPACDSKYYFGEVLPERIETREEFEKLVDAKLEELNRQHINCGEYSLYT